MCLCYFKISVHNLSLSNFKRQSMSDRQKQNLNFVSGNEKLEVKLVSGSDWAAWHPSNLAALSTSLLQIG